MLNELTKIYRKNGVLLTLCRADAAILTARGMGRRDPLGDNDGMLGVWVPGESVDQAFPGETPMVTLAGGWRIERFPERDRVVGRRRLNLSGLDLFVL